ncbi:cysteine desulfurase [Cyclonatronum proteinivorum]|uniref:cysteine desulfurase n=1 Tax=Cyclonatronum proteinivorum TaxID=1457365 RepID=A0A345UMV7_9BACT|nr:cysteine desulfurase family protein [Cyclonatronum proteinivorum]AXJ01809.1 cysteine desulfurase [Cyclonatronum proteinivorum]
MSVYFDNAATTKPDERVLEAMLPYFSTHYGNASSVHAAGRQTSVAVEEAREKIAACIGAEVSEIIFTSGGTESNNAAINGSLRNGSKRHVVTSSVEHHAVLHPLEHAAKTGVRTTQLDPGAKGWISAEAVEAALEPDTALVSLMHVNNETGAINPIDEIATLCASRGVRFHTDWVQAAGKLPLDVRKTAVDFLSVSAHKIHGPKGAGFLYVRGGTDWQPWMEGGSQERGRRGGTLNVPGIVGLGEAFRIACEEREANLRHTEHLSTLIQDKMAALLPDVARLNGDRSHAVPHILNYSFQNEDGEAADGEMLLLSLDIDGIYVSNGSACTSGTVLPSHVLLGMGHSPKLALSSIRLSLGKYNTESDVNTLFEKLPAILGRMMTLPAHD